MPPLWRAASGGVRLGGAGSDFHPATSDADFLVSFQNDSARASLSRFFDLTEVLEGMLGRTVDLISPDALTNPYVVASVNRAREVIYGA